MILELLLGLDRLGPHQLVSSDRLQAAHDAAALNKKREYAIASGRLSLAGGGPTGLSDSPAHKKHANAGNAARPARK